MKTQFLLKCLSAVSLCAMLFDMAAGQTAPPTPGTSVWVSFGNNHRLQYTQDANGNRIMDFSFAGYQGGGVQLPSATVQAILAPSGSDDPQPNHSATNTGSSPPLRPY